jgi:hypothetical protein
MSQLRERYVAAVLRSIPDDKRADVDTELRGAIDDAVEARVDQGEDLGAVEVAVLTELGDPDRLAADYADRPLWVIGPTFYLPWLRLTKTLLKIIPPVVGVPVAVAGYLTDGGLLAAFFGGLGAAIFAALSVMFWTTLGFIIAERSGEVSKKEIEPFTRKWTPDRLPTVPDRQVGYAETIGSLVVLAFLTVVIFAQRSLTPAALLRSRRLESGDPGDPRLALRLGRPRIGQVAGRSVDPRVGSLQRIPQRRLRRMVLVVPVGRQPAQPGILRCHRFPTVVRPGGERHRHRRGGGEWVELDRGVCQGSA